MFLSEMGIYKRKQESMKTRIKKEKKLYQESDQEEKKTRMKTRT